MQEKQPSISLKGFVKITRFWNLIIIVLAQYFTAYFLLNQNLIYDIDLFLLSLSTGLIAAAGYMINDYYDVKIDLINKPNEVVIGKSVHRRYALLLHTVLSTLGVTVGFYLSWQIGVVNFLCAFLLWWYSNSLKRQPFVGNFSVAVLTGMSIVVVDVLYRANDPMVYVYALFAFSITLIREIIKDMEDLKGDNTFGCKTLPIVWGIRGTKVFAYLIMILFVIIVFLFHSLFTLPLYFFGFFLLIPFMALIWKLIRADTRKDFSNLSTFCKVIMVLGILSMGLIDKPFFP